MAQKASTDRESEDVEFRRPEWFTDDGEQDSDASFKDYDITSSPNDFNVRTIVDFIESGAFKIPGFQRNYVWDIKRASKLIESILIGLPVPQVFLYQEARNSFLVIDGQQRLMSLYYFFKGRFPIRSKRPAIRRMLASKGAISADLWEDDDYFEKFNLSLRGPTPGQTSRFHGKNYTTLGEEQTTFNLRTVRNVIIKQNEPEEEDGDTSVFEIFNRLNTGGVNLKPQEIRASLYHSDLMTVLNRVNLNPVWRELIGQPEPDLHAKDTEILLRVLALTIGPVYSEPLSKFINLFAKKARKLDREKLIQIEKLFETFFSRLQNFPRDSFRVDRSGRFSIALFESVFRAACTDAATEFNQDVWELEPSRVALLKSDTNFINATKEGIGRASHVKDRYDRARVLLRAH